MRILSFDHADAGEWNVVCERSSQAWLFHCQEWIGIERTHFFPDNRSFALHDGRRLVGVQPLYFSTLGLGAWSEKLLHSGIHRHTGLALISDLEPAEAKAARSAAMRHIMEIAAAVDADRVQLNSQNLAPENRGPSRREIPFWVSEHGYFLGLGMGPAGIAPAPGLATCCADQIVALDFSQEELFSRLDESCRRAIRKAEAQGIGWREGSHDPVSDYYRLAQISAQRTGETLPPPGYYEDVWHAFAAPGHCKVLFALHQDRRVAALWLLTYKGAAHFFAGASDPEYLGARVNDFLHWAGIIWAKGEGLNCYRLGPIFPELPAEWPVARVSRFKRKFGGASCQIIQGSHFRHPEKYQQIGATQLGSLACVGTTGS